MERKLNANDAGDEVDSELQRQSRAADGASTRLSGQGILDVKPYQAGAEIHHDFAPAQNISPDDYIVRPREGRKASNQQILDMEFWKRKADAEHGRFERLAPSFVNRAASDSGEGKPFYNMGGEPSGVGASVNQSQSPQGYVRGVPRAQLDLNRGAELTKVIRELATVDFGPTGFFIVCHRDG
jgi:hypothetical protein